MSSNTVPEYYEKISDYLDTSTSLAQRVERLNAILDQMETTLLDAASVSKFSEYNLDDGQTKIRSVYRDPAALIAHMKAIDALKQLYLNRLTGRHSRLVDEKNFLRRC